MTMKSSVISINNDDEINCIQLFNSVPLISRQKRALIGSLSVVLIVAMVVRWTPRSDNLVIASVYRPGSRRDTQGNLGGVSLVDFLHCRNVSDGSVSWRNKQPYFSLWDSASLYLSFCAVFTASE